MIKKLTFLLTLMLVVTGISAQQWNLMPMPKSIEAADGAYRIQSEGVTVTLQGNYHQRLPMNAAWFLTRLGKRTTIPMLPKQGKEIVVKVNRAGTVKLGENESYQLKVTPTTVTIEAETDLGAIYAMETLLQLVNRDAQGFYIPAVTIADSPRFPWRGLMIDAGRHFMPVDIIKRNIDAMAAVKLNVLHFHLTEDQGFRIECKTFPKLHQLGSNGEYYTQEQIKEIIAYADLRGIRVMPEFDMPGHTTAWMPGAPEIASAPGPYEIEKRFGVFGATMNPTSEKTYKFLDKFFKEMAALFPDEYMHIGGDENNGEQWNANPAIQKFMKEKGIKDNHQLQAHFNKRLLKILQKHKKKMMGWDEIFQPDLPQSIVIHSWRGRQYMDEAAQKGYQSVLSNGYYIDLSFNARKHYMVDPLPDTTHLTAEQQKRILGGEAPMWAELVTLENVESRIWPRTAAIAERLWSPNPAAPIDDMYRRLMVVSQRLEETGSRHMANREPMMRRLAGTSNIQPLMLLANAAEPIEGYKRHGSQKYTTYHPLSRFVDVTMPDAPDAIEFSLLLNRFIESKSSDTYVELSKMLTRWEMNHQQFAVIAKENPLLTEVEPLSINLAMLAATTNVMLKQLYYGKMLTKDDAAKMERVIIELAKPVAEMNLPLADDAKRILELVTDSTNTLPSTEE